MGPSTPLAEARKTPPPVPSHTPVGAGAMRATAQGLSAAGSAS
jgi:hypothetical protein